MHGERGDLSVAIRTVKALTRKPEQSVVCPCPQRTLAVFIDRPHETVRQAISLGIPPEGTAMITKYPPSFHAGPQASVARNSQAENAVFRHLRCVSPVEGDETHAIESHQSATRSNPQVAIGGLTKCLRHVLR